MFFTVPFEAPACFDGCKIGRPVVRSTDFAQLTPGANSVADRTRPVARFRT